MNDVLRGWHIAPYLRRRHHMRSTAPSDCCLLLSKQTLELSRCGMCFPAKRCAHNRKMTFHTSSSDQTFRTPCVWHHTARAMTDCKGRTRSLAIPGLPAIQGRLGPALFSHKSLQNTSHAERMSLIRGLTSSLDVWSAKSHL